MPPQPFYPLHRHNDRSPNTAASYHSRPLQCGLPRVTRISLPAHVEGAILLLEYGLYPSPNFTASVYKVPSVDDLLKLTSLVDHYLLFNMSSQPSEPVSYPHLPPTLILTSTKAYFTPERTLQYLQSLLDPANNILPLPSHILFALIPDFLTIHPCSQLLTQRTSPDPSTWPLYLGAQDVSPFPTYGAYTGFVVPPALTSLGVRIVELNHAERRRFVGETDATTAAKAAAACAHGLIPLVCIGELDKPNLAAPLSQAVGGAMRQLSPQVLSVLDAVPSHAPVILAYEPVWAIGAAEPAGVDYVGPVVQAIREAVKGVAGRTGETRVVYGGSAGPGLWSGKTNGGNGLGQYVDGMFLGRFAHEIGGVQKVVEEVKESLKDKQ